jgi:hypothetical protein
MGGAAADRPSISESCLDLCNMFIRDTNLPIIRFYRPKPATVTETRSLQLRDSSNAGFIGLQSDGFGHHDDNLDR